MYKPFAIIVLIMVSVCGSINGLEIESVPSDTCPDTLATWPYGPIFEVASSGDQAYTASGTVFQIVNIADPKRPEVTGELILPERIHAIEASGDLIFVAVGLEGMKVLSVIPGSDPIEVGSIDTPFYAMDVAVSGGFAFVADGNAGVRIIDVSSPSSPVEIGLAEAQDMSFLVSVSGTRMVVADTLAFLVYDVSDPSTPLLRGSVAKDILLQPTGMTESGDHIFATLDHYERYPIDDDGLMILDVSNPSMPQEAAFVGTPGEPMDVAVSGAQAYVAQKDGGVLVLDISEPADPTEVRTIQTPGEARGVTANGGLLLVANHGEGLTLVPLLPPEHRKTMASTEAPYEAERIAVLGDTVFIGNSKDGVRILDVGNPASPNEIGVYPTPAPVMDVVVDESYAYFLTRDELRIVDPSNREAPEDVGVFDTPGIGVAVTVSGGLAYLAEYDGTLRIIDLTIQSNPVEIGTFTPEISYALDVEVSGGYAYIAAASNGLRIIDVKDPTSPTLTREYGAAASFEDVAIEGNHIYVIDRNWFQSFTNLRVFDIQDPERPVDLGSMRIDRNSYAITIDCHIAYIPAHTNLQAINIRDPEAPQDEWSIRTAGSARDVSVSRGIAYVADGPVMLSVIKTCSLFCDGFESGALSEWSSTLR